MNYVVVATVMGKTAAYGPANEAKAESAAEVMRHLYDSEHVYVVPLESLGEPDA